MKILKYCWNWDAGMEIKNDDFGLRMVFIDNTRFFAKPKVSFLTLGLNDLLSSLVLVLFPSRLFPRPSGWDCPQWFGANQSLSWFPPSVVLRNLIGGTLDFVTGFLGYSLSPLPSALSTDHQVLSALTTKCSQHWPPSALSTGYQVPPVPLYLAALTTKCSPHWLTHVLNVQVLTLYSPYGAYPVPISLAQQQYVEY